MTSDPNIIISTKVGSSTAYVKCANMGADKKRTPKLVYDAREARRFWTDTDAHNYISFFADSQGVIYTTENYSPNNFGEVIKQKYGEAKFGLGCVLVAQFLALGSKQPWSSGKVYKMCSHTERIRITENDYNKLMQLFGGVRGVKDLFQVENVQEVELVKDLSENQLQESLELQLKNSQLTTHYSQLTNANKPK